MHPDLQYSCSCLAEAIAQACAWALALPDRVNVISINFDYEGGSTSIPPVRWAWHASASLTGGTIGDIIGATGKRRSDEEYARHIRQMNIQKIATAALALQANLSETNARAAAVGRSDR